MALVPRSDKEISSRIPCNEKSGFVGPYSQCDDGEHCDDKQGVCIKGVSEKKRHPMFLIGTVIAILVGIAVVWLSRVTNQAVHKNKAFAAAYGTAAEVGLVRNAFR